MQPQQKNAMALLIFTMLVILILAWIISKDLEQVRNLIIDAGWVGLAAAVLIYAVLGASPIPSEPLTLLLTAIVGPLLTTLVAGTGNLLAALVEYFIGDRMGAVTDFEKNREKLPLGLGRLPVDSPAFLIFARMLPYTAKIVSLLAGIYRVSPWRYTWTSAVSTYFGAAMIAYGGFGLYQIGEALWRHIIPFR